MSNHIVVWMDHKEAHIFQIRPDETDKTIVAAPLEHIHHKHPRGPEGPKEHPDDAKRFFRDIGASVEASDEILVVGPSTAKLEFLRYVHAHEPALAAKITGIETVDHPTDGQLVAYAKKYFLRQPPGRATPVGPS